MESKFYKNAAEYWAQVPATVEGVLGGFGSISEIDIRGSKLFLEPILEGGVRNSSCAKVNRGCNPPSRKLALDCGAGIGRITKYLLTDYFEAVDLVEQNELFLNEAKTYVDSEKLGDLYAVGLQDFKPEKKYDIIWCQWVLGHLNDKDLKRFFKTCRDSLNENGLIFVKENVTSSNKVESDEVDSSITRPLHSLVAVFKKCRLETIKTHKQMDFPQGLYPVHMFALRPGVKKQKVPEEKVNNRRSGVKKDECTPLDKIDLVENLEVIHISEDQDK